MQGSNPGERRGGRQPGAKNKRTLEREAALAKAAAEIEGVLGDQAFDGDAHMLLMAVYKDGALPIDLRLDAARAAISFEKPRLSSVIHLELGQLFEAIGQPDQSREHFRAAAFAKFG